MLGPVPLEACGPWSLFPLRLFFKLQWKQKVGPSLLAGYPPFQISAGVDLMDPPHPLSHGKNQVSEKLGKNFYISPMKMIRLLMKEWEAVKFDLCVVAACIIVAAVMMGLYNLFS